MVEKIEVLTSKVKEFEIKGKIYKVNLSDVRELINYQKAIKKVKDIQLALVSTEGKTEEELEKTILESVDVLHSFINVVLNDNNAVEEILGDDKGNLEVLFDFVVKLQKGVAPSVDSFIQERIETEYAPE
jgi:hypothetical protein